MVAKNDTPDRMATWGSIIAAALAVAGVVFTSGSASQRLDAHGIALQDHETRLRSLETLAARLDQRSVDTQQTVHRMEGTPVPLEVH